MINIETLFFEDFCNRIWPSASDSTIPVEISCSLCRILNWSPWLVPLIFWQVNGIRRAAQRGARLSSSIQTLSATTGLSNICPSPKHSGNCIWYPGSWTFRDAEWCWHIFSFMLILMLMFMHADGCWWRLDRVFCDALRHLLWVELASTFFSTPAMMQVTESIKSEALVNCVHHGPVICIGWSFNCEMW